MKLPSRILDLSSPLDNDTVFDPPFMRPRIEYRTNAENALGRFHRRLLPAQDQRRVGGLDPRGGAVRLIIRQGRSA
jgi:hypothetical protein